MDEEGKDKNRNCASKIATEQHSSFEAQSNLHRILVRNRTEEGKNKSPHPDQNHESCQLFRKGPSSDHVQSREYSQSMELKTLIVSRCFVRWRVDHCKNTCSGVPCGRYCGYFEARELLRQTVLFSVYMFLYRVYTAVQCSAWPVIYQSGWYGKGLPKILVCVCPSVCVSVRLSIHLSVCLSVHPSVHLSVCLPTHLCVCSPKQITPISPVLIWLLCLKLA